MPSPRPQTLVASALALFAAAALGCVSHHQHRPARATVVHHPAPAKMVVVHKGPPPHAPAHGYRHKHGGGTDLVFDKGLGVYVVVGHKTTYHDGRRFYRLRGNIWQVSAKIGRGTWVSISTADIPHGLRLHHRHKARKKAHHKQHPAKHE